MRKKLSQQNKCCPSHILGKLYFLGKIAKMQFVFICFQPDIIPFVLDNSQKNLNIFIFIGNVIKSNIGLTFKESSTSLIIT